MAWVHRARAFITTLTGGNEYDDDAVLFYTRRRSNSVLAQRFTHVCAKTNSPYVYFMYVTKRILEIKSAKGAYILMTTATTTGRLTRPNYSDGVRLVSRYLRLHSNRHPSAYFGNGPGKRCDLKISRRCGPSTIGCVPLLRFRF